MTSTRTATTEHTRTRDRIATLGRFTLVVVGLYLVGRALSEPFHIDGGNPSTYAADWGGPSLAGVLAVHCVPGVLAGAWLAHVVRRARRPADGAR